MIPNVLARGCMLAVILVACGSEPPASPVPEPAVSEPLSEAPAASPPVAALACDPHNLGDFACGHAEACADVKTDDQEVDLLELLCVAQRMASPADGPTRLGQVLGALPVSFRKNFTAKHGIAKDGPRGHAFEHIEQIVAPEIAANGQSATPDFPRVLMWDERTGFTISFNGGVGQHTGGNRLDLMRYDHEAEAFDLWALDLPLARPLSPYQPHTESDDCAFCHGPHGRPIWPMYPDWPGFYGSDNDELTTDEAPQPFERTAWAHFRRCIATAGAEPASKDCDASPPDQADTVAAGDVRDRFSSLFADAMTSDLRALWPTNATTEIEAYVRDRPRGVEAASREIAFDDEGAVKAWLGLDVHETFPYRPDHAAKAAEPSRAFFHRPNLRLGVLYNRLLARAVMRRMKSEPVFAEHPRVVVASLMDCPWPEDARPVRRAAQVAFLEAAGERLPAGIDPNEALPQPVVLAALGLQIRDVDMRFSYPNPAFERSEDLTTPWARAPGPMDIGYVPYATDDMYGFAGSDLYFNSYFDGSATFNELLVAHVLAVLAESDPALASAFVPHTLRRKYEKLTPRWALDEVFFEQVDALGAWFPLPYPRHLRPLHDREPFAKRKNGRGVFYDPYLEVCAELRRGIAAP